jgi:phosphoadenosine phosphosulfate reductase
MNSTAGGLENNMEESKKMIINKKIDDAKKEIRKAFQMFKQTELAITWTGGKDSTLTLWLIRQVCEEDDRPLPTVFTISEHDVFTEIEDFMKEYANKWSLDLVWYLNEDVVKAAGGELGAIVQVKDLNERNQKEIQRIGYEEDEFIFEAESYTGNHLMKTVMFNKFIEDRKIKAIIQGIRWDEHQARMNDEYFTHYEAAELSPEHTRICPILHFTERDIWNVTHGFEIPYNSLYQHGYRSLGAKSSSKIAMEGVPAWEQDLENTGERDGRRQDKEEAMEKLRKLGYM